MDQLHQQILALEQKVDRVYQVVEHLSRQVSEYYSSQNPSTVLTAGAVTAAGTPQVEVGSVSAESHQIGGIEGFLEHKDVLLDTNEIVSPPNQTQIQPVSLDIQVRRLNTQLTAAYNRIAALEEQLLARRAAGTANTFSS